ncbi:MAG: hypothetical protein COA82_13515 [Alkaliphilus sp.]|nr:hypothetical protein [bacterium AH-315-L21]MBN4069727.1 hypothetical protein [bacterium AH-315-G05]PHS28510.1 MAG: hypothetical protein COA82_13515 [Alkaliphilus sp.]
MGLIDPKNINAIKNKCDISILCATAKPYEIAYYDKANALLDYDNAHTVFSFMQRNEKRRLISKYKNVYFSNFSPDLFDGKKNKGIWEHILDEHILS